MAKISCSLLVAVLASLSGPVLADRSEENVQSLVAQMAERLTATTQRVHALQEKQERVMDKLGAAAKAGKLEALNKASDGRLAAQLKSHLSSLKAELDILRAPAIEEAQKVNPTGQFPEYSHFKLFAQQIRDRSRKIHEAIDQMAGSSIKDMLEKSHEYKKQFQGLLTGTKEIEKNAIPAVTKEIAHATVTGLTKVKDVDFSAALTRQDRDMLNVESKQHPEYEKLFKEGIFPKEETIKNADFGKDPYESMYQLPGEDPREDGAKWVYNKEGQTPIEGQMDQAAQAGDAQAEDWSSAGEPEKPKPPFMVIQIPPGKNGAMVEVQTRSMELGKNASDASH